MNNGTVSSDRQIINMFRDHLLEHKSVELAVSAYMPNLLSELGYALLMCLDFVVDDNNVDALALKLAKIYVRTLSGFGPQTMMPDPMQGFDMSSPYNSGFTTPYHMQGFDMASPYNAPYDMTRQQQEMAADTQHTPGSIRFPLYRMFGSRFNQRLLTDTDLEVLKTFHDGSYKKLWPRVKEIEDVIDPIIEKYDQFIQKLLNKEITETVLDSDKEARDMTDVILAVLNSTLVYESDIHGYRQILAPYLDTK